MPELKDKDLLIPLEVYEKEHKIRDERNDIPPEYLGFCPSKYYKMVDMNVTDLSARVDKKFLKFSHRNPKP